MCTLRISGNDLDVEALAGSLTLEPAATYRRGDVWIKATGRRRQTSGINIGVSDASFGNLAEQITDVCSFIEEHKSELAVVRSFAGVEHVVFDFPVEEKEVTIPRYRFAARRLELLASIGADLQVSLYPAAKDGSTTT